MDLSDESVSFGDFSGLDDATSAKVYRILHGSEVPKQIEFPWAPDVGYPQTQAPVEPGFCPMDAVQAIPGAPIFVQPYPVPPGIYPVPTVVAPFPVQQMVNGLPIGQPYPPVPVQTEPIYPAIPPVSVPMELCNGPSGYSRQVAAPPGVRPPPGVGPPQRQAVPPVRGPQPEFDFVYSDPGTDVPVSTSTELIQECQNQNTASTSDTPDRRSDDVRATDNRTMNNVRASEKTTDVPVCERTTNANLEKDIAVISLNKTETDTAKGDVSREESVPAKDNTPKSVPTSPPQTKSWAGLFKSSNAIVTYTGIEDSGKDPSPPPPFMVTEKNRDVPAKMPVPVTEDSAACQLGVDKLSKKLKPQYVQERTEVEKAINSGMGTDERLTSAWHHYDLLHFLGDPMGQRSQSNLSSQMSQDYEAEEHMDYTVDRSIEGYEDDQLSEVTHSTKKPMETQRMSKKRKREERENIILERATAAIERATKSQVQVETTQSVDDIFGQYVSSELKTITDERLKKIIKHKIQNTIFECTMSMQLPTQMQMPSQIVVEMPNQMPPNAMSLPTCQRSFSQTSPKSFQLQGVRPSSRRVVLRMPSFQGAPSPSPSPSTSTSSDSHMTYMSL